MGSVMVLNHHEFDPSIFPTRNAEPGPLGWIPFEAGGIVAKIRAKAQQAPQAGGFRALLARAKAQQTPKPGALPAWLERARKAHQPRPLPAIFTNRKRPIPARVRVLVNRRPEQMAGLGRFLKKAAKAVTKIARAPIKLVAPKLAAKMEKFDNKVIDKVDDIHTKINDFAKRNAKYIIAAVAVAVTIYFFPAALPKIMAALAKLKTAAIAGGKWMLAKGATLVSALTKIKDGKKLGELSQPEVQALAEANAATGENVTPPEVLKYVTTEQPAAAPAAAPAAPEAPSSFATVANLGVEALTRIAARPQAPNLTPQTAPGFGPGEGAGGGAGAYPGAPEPDGLPGWVPVAGIAAAALAGFLLLRK